MYKPDDSLNEKNWVPIVLPTIESILSSLQQKGDFDETYRLGSKEFEIGRALAITEIR
jgi:hypothetical protein